MSGYVGANSVAEKTGKLYWGDGASLAQAVQKAYWGDPRGVAELWYQLSTPLGDRAVAGKVYFNVNNIRTEWIIVHQGLPGDMYDASCFGTWLLCNSARFTGSYKSSGTGYANSDSQIYLEDTFFRMIKADIKPLIKKVRIPYMGTESFPMEEDRREGADGLATKVFPLSITEPSAVSSAVCSVALNRSAVCGSRANPASASLRIVAGMVSVSERPSRAASTSARAAAAYPGTAIRSDPRSHGFPSIFSSMACGFCAWSGFRFRDSSPPRGGVRRRLGSLRRPAYIPRPPPAILRAKP